MSTSLAAQLQKLAVPQTSLLQRDKKRASLLFDPKVAAGIDRDTFYDIGISGLRELQKYNDEFVIFENTLFSPTSRNIERAVESKDSNAKLNKNIKKFLMMLSPYFLLKSAHKALEWLVNRFSIHEYNKEDFFKLIFPYHETNIFARCLQLFNLHSSNDRWHWLRPLQKPGIHLPKLTLYNHCASDVGFLQFVADTVFTAVKENGVKSNALTTLFTFYCTTTIGALEHTKEISEPQITAILPPLLKGLSSHIPDYTASAYMITAQLLKKTKLSQKILNSLVVRITSDSQKHLRTEATLLLLLIYQSQQDNYTVVHEKALRNLVKCDWFAVNLGKLAAGGSYVMPLLVPVLTSVMKMLQDELYRKFIVNLITEVRLADAGADILIKIILDLCPLATQHEDSPSDNEDYFVKSKVPVAEWYASVLKQLETVYPNAFDQVIRDVMSTERAQTHRQALHSVMNFVMSSGRRNNSLNTFEKLYHPNAEFRANAVHFLVKHFDGLTVKDKEMLEGAVGERMLDEDKRVVHAVLQLDKDKLIDLLSQDTFINLSIKLLIRCTKDQDWLGIAEKLVEILCSEQFCKDTKLFLPILPFLFPITDQELAIAHKILASPFATHHTFLQHARTQIKIGISSLKFCKIVYQSLVDDISPRNIFVLMEDFKAITGKTVLHNYLVAVFISTSLRSNCSAKLGVAALQTVTPYLATSKPVSTRNNEFCIRTCIKSAGKGVMPLEGLFHCIETIIHNVDCPKMLDSWLNLVTPNESVNFLITLLATLVQGCANNNNQTHVMLCSNLLKQFLTKFFPSFKNRINFLANVIVVDDFSNLKLNVKSQLRIINVLHSLLAQSDNLKWTVDLGENILVPAALIGLTNPLREIRRAAMDILVKITTSVPATTDSSTYLPLLQEIVQHKEEILLDTEQLALILYTVSTENKQLTSVLKHLFNTAADTNTQSHISSMLLRILTFINSSAILETTSKLATAILKNANNSNIVLDTYRSSAFYNIVLRFNETTAKDLTLECESWKMISYGLKQDVVSLEYNSGQFACPAVLILEQISRELYANLSFEVQQALFKLLVEIATEAENPEVVSSVNKVIKKIDLDAKILLDDLTIMRDAKSDKTNVNPKRKFRRANEIPTADILVKLEWKRGITVLEFIQDKKKLTNVNLLLPLMFGVLKKCLDFDEQSSVEYPKQLLLSAILHCCNKMELDDEPLPANAFNMELVVQCIRASQNPQTHHHALLVLAHTASLIPEQVLHNIMAIFTFMGSSVLRHDDAYSFQIISKIIETVIPILIQVKDSTTENNVASVLRVFVDVILDVPEHRRMPLFNKLLVTLGVEEYLWMFLLLVFEAHVLHGNEPKPKDTKSRLLADAEPLPKRLDVATNIALEFSPEICIKTSIKLLEYLKNLPTDKDENSMDVDSTTFNVKQHSAKQFRHYKYTLVTFLSSLLSAKQLVNKIAVLSSDDTLAMEPFYKNIIIHILTYIQGVSKIVDRMASTPQAQYWKVMVHHCYDILDSVNALLTSEMFLLVIRGLIAHNIPTVRRKAMELLNTKLQYQPSFFYTNKEDTEITDAEGLFALMPSLVGIIKTIVKEDTEPEYELTQQTALLSLKLLIKLLAAKNPEKFTPILDYVTDLMKSDKVQGNILASVVLCLAELCSKLRAHAIPALVKFMPAVIKVLKMQKHQESPGLLLMCIVTAIQKIVESLPLFLSPYLEKLLCELTVLSAKWSDEEDDKKLSPFVKKLAGIRSNIGSVIPSRVLIPVIGETYKTLLSKREYTAIGPLMNVLAENLATLHGSDLTTLLPDLTTFFLAALQFRTDNDGTVSADDITIVEDHVIKTLTVLVLKLSETTFRPFYYRLFDWAVRSESSNEKVITFYRLSHGIADSLKGLFVLFAGHFVKNASSLLDACNAIKNENLYFTDERKNILLVQSILSTLRAVFLYDSQNFVDKERFEALMQPIVDQLENTVGGVESLTDRATNLIVPCIAQFAVAAADDAMWKQLNYQILLKTRHNVPAVRLIGLHCVLEVARKVGEDFLPLLPETIPFLAELLEDEDEMVELACQKVVQDLEKVLGEPLQKYF